MTDLESIPTDHNISSDELLSLLAEKSAYLVEQYYDYRILKVVIVMHRPGNEFHEELYMHKFEYERFVRQLEQKRKHEEIVEFYKLYGF